MDGYVAAAHTLLAGAGGACCVAAPLPPGAQEVTAGTWLGRAALAGLLTALACLALPVGAALGVYARPPGRVLAVATAFGSGALIQALVLELALEGAERLVRDVHLHPVATWLWVAAGFVAGGLLYFGANRLVERRGGAFRSPATARAYVMAATQAQAGDILERLSRVALLRALPAEEIQELLPYVLPVHVPAGQVIFRRGDAGDALYLIERGRVDILASDLPGEAGADGPAPGGPAPGGGNGQGTRPAGHHGHHPGGAPPAAVAEGSGSPAGAPTGIVLACLGEGQSFGEMALLNQAPRSATAVAVEETALWRIARDDFERAIARSPALRHAVEELQTQRLLENLRTAGEGEAARWQEAALAGIRRRVSRSVQAVGLRGHRESLPIAIYLGALLDGIPASLAIGAAFTGLATLHVGALVAVFAAGLPEAMSSAAGMRAAGVNARRIFGLWGGLLVGRTAAAAAGNAFLFAAPPTAITFIEALAGGGVLAVLATIMMPEAYEEGGPLAGLATIAGFLCTFFFAVLALH